LNAASLYLRWWGLRPIFLSHGSIFWIIQFASGQAVDCNFDSIAASSSRNFAASK
jgi:hypothetical protein